MINLPPEKRNQLLLVLLVTAGLASGLWLGLIRKQQASLRNLANQQAVAESKLSEIKRTIDSSEQIEARLADSAKLLATIEEGMATGDLYSWVITTIRQFKAPYKVEIPQFSQIDGPRDMSMLAGFPYKQASVGIGGTATYYELGRFVSDFENQFPYARLSNLTLEPIAGVGAGDREKLSFKVQITALVKPGAS